MEGKYGKTYHLPWSASLSKDDRLMPSLETLSASNVIVTEKLDGENTSMTKDRIWARSVDSISHPSRNWVKALWGSVKHLIPSGYRIVGENVYAKHSIYYDNLPSYFLVFGIYDEEKSVCLSWEETAFFASEFGLQTVPVLYQGAWDIEAVKACYTGVSRYGQEQEGYVVRIVSEFHEDARNISMGKYVREGHVQQAKHWMHSGKITVNGMKGK